MDEIRKAIQGARAAQRGRIMGSFSNFQEVTADEDAIRKGESDIIEKSRSGVYADTAENRRLGRVGQTFGTKKQGRKAHAEQVSASLTREQKEKEYQKKFEEYKKTSDFDKEKKELAKKIKEHYPSRGELSDEELGEYVKQSYIGRLRQQAQLKKSEDDELNPFEKAAAEADM